MDFDRMRNDKSFARVFCIIPWAIALAAFGYLLIKRFPPSGIVTFDIPFDGSSAWMDPFLPAERTTSPGMQSEGWRGQRVLQDPVYSSARVPGVFDELEMQIEFRTRHQDLVELGILRDEASMSFDFVPLWFGPLSSASVNGSPEWQFISNPDGRSGYVRTGVSSALLETSRYQKLALFHASATPLEMKDPDGTVEQETRISLRGGHDIWALPAGDTLSFTFEFQDANRKRGSDAIVFQILQDDRMIKTDAIGIGGSLDAHMGTVFSKTVRVSGLAPGVYRIRVIADDDIFIRSVRTPTRRWVVGPRLVFGDTVGYATSVQSGIAWTDSRHLTAETFHVEGLQTLTVGNVSSAILETHKTYRLDRTDSETLPQKVSAPKGDIRLVGDGFFAFSPEAFFVPQPRRITTFTDPDREGIDGILTNYIRPEMLEDGWMRATVRFDLDPSRDHARFALSAPGLLEYQNAVDIRRVRLIYRRPPFSLSEWTRVLRREISNAWHRIRRP